MILVTGAAGKTGRAIIRALLARKEAVRALVHGSAQIQDVATLGTQEVVFGDLVSKTAISRAVQGARAIYHICPNVSPEEIHIGQTMISAAQAAGIEHFVFHSVLHPQTEAMPHHWKKLRVEELLFESGLPFTVLQPAAYMQNILAHWEKISVEGIYPVPYPADTQISMVDLDDVAQAAAIVLTETGHTSATYELVGTHAMTQSSIAKILSQQLGHRVQIKVEPYNAWEEQARASSLGDYQIETLLKMFHYYERNGLSGNPNVLSWLLGRAPTTFEAFIKRVLQDPVRGKRS